MMHWSQVKGHRRGSGEPERKRKETNSVLYGTTLELVQVARTQEETTQKIDEAERFNRSMGVGGQRRGNGKWKGREEGEQIIKETVAQMSWKFQNHQLTGGQHGVGKVTAHCTPKASSCSIQMAACCIRQTLSPSG